jgi:hypothetical protein
MKTKHTPGPWHCVDEYEGTIPIDAPSTSTGLDNSVEVCRVSCDDEKSQTANAMLISAAPDLLDSLEKLLSDEGPIIGSGWENPYVSQAYAALLKARGLDD